MIWLGMRQSPEATAREAHGRTRMVIGHWPVRCVGSKRITNGSRAPSTVLLPHCKMHGSCHHPKHQHLKDQADAVPNDEIRLHILRG